MSTIKVVSMTGAEVGTVELCDAIFGLHNGQPPVSYHVPEDEYYRYNPGVRG